MLQATPFARFIAAAVVGYVLGSCPSGPVVSLMLGRDERRPRGSGETGATSVLRTIGAGTAVLVALLDVGKGFASVLVMRTLAFHVAEDALLAVHGLQEWGEATEAFAAPIGHNYSAFIRFKGGRGIGTGGGALPLIAPRSALFRVVAIGTHHCRHYTCFAWLRRGGNSLRDSRLPPCRYRAIGHAAAVRDLRDPRRRFRCPVSR